MAAKGIVTIEAQFKAGVKRDEQIDAWVSYAPLFQVYSQGETKSEAQHALADAVTLLLTTALRDGVFDEVLKGARLSPLPKSTSLGEIEEYIYVQERVLEQEDFDVFDVPVRFPLVTPAIAMAAVV